MIASGVIGAVYGVALLFGLQVIIDLFNLLPVNFLGSLGQVSAGITLAFAIFPAVTVAVRSLRPTARSHWTPSTRSA